MAVTRSRTEDRVQVRRGPRPSLVWRGNELLWTFAAGLFVVAGLYLVYQSKAQEMTTVKAGLAAKQLLNLNDLSAREDLLPALSLFTDSAEREFVARKIYGVIGEQA